MERDSDEDGCFSDVEEGGPAQIGTAENEQTFHTYHMSRSKFQSTVVVRKYESKGLSFQLWPAASAMCWYLENEFGDEGMCLPTSSVNAVGQRDSVEEVAHLPGVVEEMRSRSISEKYFCPPMNRRMKILELGSGTGMVGIVAGCLGAHVVLTDLPHVLPNAEYNLESNRGVTGAAGGIVESKVLRWGVEEDVSGLGDLSSFDLILASDVVYYDTLYKPLLQTLRWLVGASGDEALFPDRRKNEILSNGSSKPQIVSLEAFTSDEPASQTPFAYNPEIRSENDRAENHKWASFSAKAERRSKENIPETTSKTPVIFLAHMRRWKRDAHFFKQASKAFDVHVIHRHPPQENARVGPIIYRLSVKPIHLTNPASLDQKERSI